MSKELPKMYQNQLKNKVVNIQHVYSTIGKNERRENHRQEYSSISIERKIEDIFNAPDYVYKADVFIVTSDETIKRRIVARDKNSIITIDNEYIPISMIRDIYRS